MHRSRIIAVLFTVALVAAGCAEQAPEPPVPVADALFAAGAMASSIDHGGSVDREIEVVMADYWFTPAAIEVEAGESVRFVVANTGSFEHEFRLTNRHGALEHVAGGHEDHHDEAEVSTSSEVLMLVPPGEAMSLTVDFTESSAFDVLVCLIPGHFEAGMESSVTVHGAMVAMGAEADHHGEGEADHHEDGAADHHEEGEAAHDESDGHHEEGEEAHDEGEADHHEEGEAAHEEGAADHHEEGEEAHEEGAADHQEEGEADHHEEGEAAHDESDGHHEEGEEAHDESDGHHDDGMTTGDFDRILEITMLETAFAPDVVNVAAGETIRFQVFNASDVDHEFRLTNAHAAEEALAGDHHDDAGGHDHGEAVVLVAAGATEMIDVTFDEHAEFEIAACLLDGHYEAGMIATLAIEG